MVQPNWLKNYFFNFLELFICPRPETRDSHSEIQPIILMVTVKLIDWISERLWLVFNCWSKKAQTILFCIFIVISGYNMDELLGAATFSTMTFSIMTFFATLSIKGINCQVLLCLVSSFLLQGWVSLCWVPFCWKSLCCVSWCRGNYPINSERSSLNLPIF